MFNNKNEASVFIYLNILKMIIPKCMLSLTVESNLIWSRGFE